MEAKPLEAQIQRKLMQVLAVNWPDAYIRKIAQGYYSHGGIPDILMCVEGKFIAIEVKTDKGHVTKLQSRELTQIMQARGMAFVCYGLDDIGRIIRAVEDYINGVPVH